MKEKHFFIGTYGEFLYFIKKWDFNRSEWMCLDSYEKALGRNYKKGYVHYGDTAYQLKDCNKLQDYVGLKTNL